MGRFSRIAFELRRRGMYRTAGLYIGIIWIALQAASILYPAFDAPEWSMRVTVTVSIIGFPITILLSWIYASLHSSYSDAISDDERDSLKFGGRKMDFAVIGVLSVALAFSLYLNFSKTPGIVNPPSPISVLIADVDNQTNNSLFEGPIETMLGIGLEEATHVSSFHRGSALQYARTLDPTIDQLDKRSAQQAAFGLDVDRVIGSRIIAREAKYILEVETILPASGQAISVSTVEFESIDNLIFALGRLAQQLRIEFGDTSNSEHPSSWSTYSNVYAWKAYTTAIDFSFEGNAEEAMQYYKRAVDIDPGFTRAYLGWSLEAFKAEDNDLASELWDKSLEMLNTLTERERLRTLGIYYAVIEKDYRMGVEVFSELAEKYSGEAAGLNNAAVSAFLTLDFDTAMIASRRLLDLYPKSVLYLSNHSLYSMYSGDFDGAAVTARNLLSNSPTCGTPYLPLAMSQILDKDYESARESYGRMIDATTCSHRKPLAILGLGDLEAHVGSLVEAREVLHEAIREQAVDDMPQIRARALIALGEIEAIMENAALSIELANQALHLTDLVSVKVASARLFIAAGDFSRAQEIATELVSGSSSHDNAYGMMIEAMISRTKGELQSAITQLESAISVADLWLIRFEQARTQIEAGELIKSLETIGLCEARIGEATSVFLDDTPTIRYASLLRYWKGRSQEGLGMRDAAIDSFEEFLLLRPEGSKYAKDASRRLEQIR